MIKKMTENKRYFERMWGEEYYIFDSQTISEKEFDKRVEYEDYQAFSSSMTGDEVVELLNELDDKCKFLEIENEALEDAATKYAERYHESLKENKQLKQKVDFYKYFQKDARELEKENEQLRQQLNDKEVEWLRDNTVWEQMPSSKRTFTKTKFEE